MRNAHLHYLEGARRGTEVEIFAQPKTNGDLAVKDIIAHLSYMKSDHSLFISEQGALNPLRCISRNLTKHSKRSLTSIRQERLFDKVWEELSNIRDQTIQRLESFSDKEISQPGFFPWLKNSSLGQLVFDYVVEHEKEHENNIRAWRNPPEQP